MSVVIPSRNASAQTARTVHALLNQVLPAGFALEIIVVDDGSTDGAAERLGSEFGTRIKLIRHARNAGRSAARNTGAREASGRILLVLDCDCTPGSTDYLKKLLRDIARNRVHIGEVRYKGNGFWPIYQRLGASRRLREHKAGEPGALSTANMLLERDTLLQLGGYDEGYRYYGFEDRDLLLRLHAAGISTHLVSDASVIHSDPTHLSLLMAKNKEAAWRTAPRFRTRHPQAYGRLGQSHMDIAIHPVLTCLGAAVGLLLLPAAGIGERLVQCKALPLRARVVLTRCFLASAFCLGSIKTWHSPRHQ
ncbi:glycosyltransferase family 2 protein [Dyella choica]|uniref:glycosyltransferase family 2 protein n=1 Tax=Dyella choica TaxID=1927959 RepID=UPI001315349E|nr:glycosyltransferase family 2 protein [Dyella choica]